MQTLWCRKFIYQIAKISLLVVGCIYGLFRSSLGVGAGPSKLDGGFV